MHRFALPDLAVPGHNPAILSRQLEYLRNRHYSLMSVMELVKHLDEGIPLKENTVVFTVDDGYADFAAVAAPVFEAYDCPVTVFLVTDFVSGRLWNWFDRVEWAFANSNRREVELEMLGESVWLRWSNSSELERASHEMVERLKRVRDADKEQLMKALEEALEVEIPGQVPDRYQAMNWDEVRTCASRGVTFGPHTVTHPILSQTDGSRADREISESWRTVVAETEAAVPVFCYPNGTPADFSSREKESVARAGMTAAVSAINGSLESFPSGIANTDRYAMPRFGYSEDRPRFVQIASGLEAMKARIRGRFASAS